MFICLFFALNVRFRTDCSRVLPRNVSALNSQQEIPICLIEAGLFSSDRSLHRDLKRLFTNEPSYMIDYYGLLIERGGLTTGL